MRIYNLYIFNRNKTLLYYGEWGGTNFSGQSIEEEGKIMFRTVFAIRGLARRISRDERYGSYVMYPTRKYLIHSLQVPSGLNLIVTTDVNSEGIPELLLSIYKDIYLRFVLKNPDIIRKRITDINFKNELDYVIALYKELVFDEDDTYKGLFARKRNRVTLMYVCV